MIKKIWKRFGNRDKLAYLMVIAFGISFLGITLHFQFGNTVITTPSVIVELDYGYITETRLWVRIIEGMLSLGLITLGGERLRNYGRKKL